MIKNINNFLKNFNNIKLYSESHNVNGIPIYVILTSGNNPVSKAIMKFTNSKYSHCVLALNHYETISMGTTSKNFGIAVESILEFPDRHRNEDIKICRRMINIETYKAIVSQVEIFKKNYKKIDYSFGKLTNFLDFIPRKKKTSYKDETSFICSEFVAYLLSNIEDIDSKLVDKGRVSKYMLSPKEIELHIMSSFETLYEGNIYQLPLQLFYSFDKKYIKDKAKIVKDIREKLKTVKQYTESDNIIKTLYNDSSVSLEIKNQLMQDKIETQLQRIL